MNTTFPITIQILENERKYSQSRKILTIFFWEFLQILTIFSPRFLQILTIFIPAGQAESGISLLLIARCFARSGLPADGKDIEQEDDVHHQGVEDSRDGHWTAVEDERGKGNGNGLGGVLHADFDDNGAADSRREPAKAREQRTAQHSQQDERGRGHSKDSKVVHYLLGVLEKKHQGQEHQGRESGFAENPANLGGGMRPESAEQDAGKDGNEKQDEVLQQELALLELAISRHFHPMHASGIPFVLFCPPNQMQKNMAITINASELRQILDLTPADQNIMLIGKHGIGKSEILSRYYRSKGFPVITFFLGQMSDPGDLIGLPHKNPENDKTEFLPPYWFPTDGRPIVLFLDELNRARPEILQSIMDLTLNKSLAGKTLPEGSRIISAVNEGEEYQLTELDPALVSRFNLYRFRPSVPEWLLWASECRLDERVINFIQKEEKFLDDDSHPAENSLDRHPDRRSWKRVSDIIKNQTELSLIHKKLISGQIGTIATNKFFQYLQEKETLSGKDILLDWNKHKAKVQQLALHELSLLNESLFRFMETSSELENNKTKVGKALESYLKLLQENNMNEAYAHWISLYNSGNYPKAILFILSQTPRLYKDIMQFINSL